MENKETKKSNNTGRYVYDKNLKKVVKISDEITGLKKNNSSTSSNNTPSCGLGGCCPTCG
ncbi:MAG: hypothetical protein K6357_08630 [Elusimicrobiota bacterium]